MPQVQTLPDAQKISSFSGLDALLAIQFDKPALKRAKAYGHNIAKHMWSYITDSNIGYYSGRYRQWNENRNWLKGVIDDKDFKSYMGVEGNQTWLNMDYTVIKVLTRYDKSIVNRFMDREEKPNVRATDILSSRFREREKIFAKYRMQQQARIKQMEKVSGMQLETGFTPEDEDQLDLYYKVEWRMPEEAFMEDTVWQVFQNSDYEYLKRTLIRDGIRTNLYVTKLEEQPCALGKTLAERLKIRRCDPMNTVYNIFKNANGSDISIIGEARTYKISDARRKYPNVSEKEWFKIAQVAAKGLDQAEPLNWIDTYIFALNRPYDDYSSIFFDFEVKVYDTEYSVEQKTSDGNDIIVAKKGRPENLGPDKKLIEEGRFNMYAGVYAVVADVMIKWDVLPNQIRPFQNGVDVFSSYSVQYPDADGFYVPSLAERGIPPVRQLVLIALKIQQMVALMEPDNVDFDISGLRNGLDVGTGAKLKPIQLVKLKKQTGVGYYDSEDDSGVTTGAERRSPYESRAYGGNVAQLNALIPLYNFWLMRLNDEWGENQETLGQPTAAKKSAEATRVAAMNGQNATEFIYDHFIAIMEQNATKIVYRLWDMLVLEAGDYKQMSGIDRDLMNATFDVNIDMYDKRGRKERLSLRIQGALEKGLITMSMAERLEDIDNPKTAILYLEKVEKQQKKDAMAARMKDIQLNAQVQQQSTQIATHGKIQTEFAKAQAKAVVEHLKSDDVAFNDMVRMINDAEKEALKIGVPLPQDIQILKQYLTQDILTKHAMKDQQAQQGAGQQQQQQPAGQPAM